MIYDWTRFASGEAAILLEEISSKDAKRMASDIEHTDREFFLTSITNSHLMVDGSYVHPSKDDVFVLGEDTYALSRVIESRKSGTTWYFKLLIYKLVKHTFAPTKSFNATYKT